MGTVQLKIERKDTLETPPVGYVYLNVTENLELIMTDSNGVKRVMKEVEYNVTASCSPDNEGHNVTGAGSYKAGAEVTIEAVPFEGHVFVKFTDESNTTLSEVNPYQFNMPEEDVIIVAVFQPEA